MAEDSLIVLSRADAAEIAQAVGAAFSAVLTPLGQRREEGTGVAPRLFPSGVELIGLTLKVGSNIEFSVRVAGKDAPKGEVAQSG